VECSSIAVLQSMLHEQNRRLIDEIFYLLTAIHDADAIKIISESLHSESLRARANATEALESLTSPQTTRLITPLFDPEMSPAQLLALGQEVWDVTHLDTAQAIRQLVTDPSDPWLRAVATFALGEIGAAIAEKSADADSRKRARRSPPSDLWDALDAPSQDQPAPSQTPTPACPFTLPEIDAMLNVSLADPVDEVRLAAQAAGRVMAGRLPTQAGQVTDATRKEEILLSTIERVIFLKEVSFFRDMTIDQLKVLASACQEELFEEGACIFEEGDTSDTLYVVVNGRVSIERETRRGSFARLATLGARTYFGEMALFDNSPRSATATALQDTLTLSLGREPLIALARQHPDLSLELIKVLSNRLREANDRITELTRSRPRELQKLYDKFD
jgi:hypothetical protein